MPCPLYVIDAFTDRARQFHRAVRPFQPGAVHGHRKGRPGEPVRSDGEADRARRAVLRTRDEPLGDAVQLPTNGDDGLGFEHHDHKQYAAARSFAA